MPYTQNRLKATGREKKPKHSLHDKLLVNEWRRDRKMREIEKFQNLKCQGVVGNPYGHHTEGTQHKR